MLTTGQFTTSWADEGQHTVKVVLYDQNDAVVDNQQWTVNVADVPAEFDVSEIYFQNAAKGETVQTSFIVKNTGNEDITDVTAELLNVNSDYNAQVITATPFDLSGGEQKTVQLQITVPNDEVSDKHSIGTLKFSGNNDLVTKEADINLETESLLTIDNIDYDDIKLDKDFDVTVNIKNDYTEDMRNVKVKVKLLDGSHTIDDDSKEESRIRDGDDKDFDFTFDLSNENLDQEEYTIQVTVEGTADDSEHTYFESTKEETVQVDRKNHQVLIRNVDVTPNLLQCSTNRQFSVDVDIANVGESNEDNVDIRVSNDDLKLDLERSDIQLDDYSGSDNDYSTTFNYQLTDAVEGDKYPLTVQVYRNGDLQDEQEVTIDVADCLSTGTDKGSVDLGSGLNADLQNKLNEYVKARQQSTVQGSFRESDAYTVLLGILVVLAFVAVLLTVAVLIVKKR